MIRDVVSKAIKLHTKQSGLDFGSLGYDDAPKKSIPMSGQMCSAVKRLEFLMDINTPIICIQNHDFARFDIIIKQVALNNGNLKVVEWNPAMGITDFGTQKQTPSSTEKNRTELFEFLSERLGLSTNDIIVIKDAHPYIKGDFPDIISALHYSGYRKLYDKPEVNTEKPIEKCYKGYNQTIIIMSSVQFPMPQEIAPYVEYLDLEVPDEREIENMINSHLSLSPYLKNNLTSEQNKSLIRSLQGMSAFDIDRLLDSVISENGNLTSDDAKAIKEKQKQIIKNSGLLELVDADIDEDAVGGLDYLLDYLDKKAAIMKDVSKAEEFGVDIPKGILLVGMPGCGKSLSAKMCAKKFNGMPLLKMDMGSLQGGLVGDSERNMREALKQAEQAAPCILWIDEVEKAFSGTQGDNEAYTMRMFGYFLSWMQDHTRPVFVFATANNVDHLRPEFLRAGRFDEKFLLNLPTDDELKKIFRARLSNIKRHLSGFYKESDIDQFVRKCKGFNGADVENAINSTLEDMFEEGVGKSEFVSRLLTKLGQTKGIKEAQKDQIKAMEESFEKYSFVDATVGPDGKYKRKEKRNHNSSSSNSNSGRDILTKSKDAPNPRKGTADIDSGWNSRVFNNDSNSRNPNNKLDDFELG